MSESNGDTLRLSSDCPDEVSAFIGAAYTSNRFERLGRKKDLSADVVGHVWQGIGVYDVNFEMPFSFLSETSTRRHMILGCRRGTAKCGRGGDRSTRSVGDVLPISSGEYYSCRTGDKGVTDLAVVIDAQYCDEFLQQWVGEPVLSSVEFGFSTLSPTAATQWNLASMCLLRMMHMTPMPEAAITGLVEHMLKLLLIDHPHSHARMFSDKRATDARRTREAADLISRDPMRWQTLSALAKELGCTANALDRGLRRYTGKCFEQIRSESRMHALHRAFHNSDVATVATLNAFGYSIAECLRTSLTSQFGDAPGSSCPHRSLALATRTALSNPSPALSEDLINWFIDSHLSAPLRLSDIARFAGLSEYATIVAFKESFSTTPLQHVADRRLSRARWLLRHTARSIRDIAIECGFGSQSYMTSAMQRRWGTTPRQVRVAP